MLVIIGGFVYWFPCSLLFFILIFFLIFNFNYFILYIYTYIYVFFFLSFFLPFLLSRMADRVLVLQPGVRPEPLRWESRVHDMVPPETSQPHIISIGESSPRDLHLNTKTQLHAMARKLQYWMPHAKQLARKEHKPTY